MAEITSEDRAAVAKETQARIKGIMTHEEAKGREGLAQHLAYDTDNTVEQATAILAASPKAEEPAKEEPVKEEPVKEEPVEEDGEDGDGDQARGGSQFEQAMNNGDHPNIGAGGKDNAGGKGASKIDQILGAQALATGRKPPERATA